MKFKTVERIAVAIIVATISFFIIVIIGGIILYHSIETTIETKGVKGLVQDIWEGEESVRK